MRQFVAERPRGGRHADTPTLAEFAACDLNAKTAADRLHLHVNTAYYRLERIAERTGCDLRRLADVSRTACSACTRTMCTCSCSRYSTPSARSCR